MKEIIDLLKELLLIKPENQSTVGLIGLKKHHNKQIVVRTRKKVKQDVKISDLMRRR